MRLHGIWNRTEARAEAAARRFGIPTVYHELAELIADEQVDCFCVLVNPRVIPEVVIKLAPRGLPIFTEKSPGWSYREARRLADTVKTANVVGFNRRYMPLNRQFKAVFETLEMPYFVECHFYRHGRLCDEFVIETGVHGINYLEYLCGPVKAVQTDRRADPANGTWSWQCRFEFSSGLHGLMKLFPCCGSSVERYEVHSRELSAYLHSPQVYSSDYPGRLILHREGQEIETTEGNAEAPVVVTAGFLDEYLDFFAAAASGSATISNFDNACPTMRVAEAIQRGEDYQAEVRSSATQED